MKTLPSVGHTITSMLCVPLLVFLVSCSSSEPASKASVTADAVSKPAESNAGLIRIPVADQKRAAIEVQEARTVFLPGGLTVSGHITLNEDITHHVSSLVPGRVASVAVNVGDQVKAGDVLALILSDQVHETRIEYVQALKTIVRLENLLRSAERVRDRADRLYNAKAGSLSALERTETDVRSARTELESAEIEKERLRDEIEDYLKVSLPDANGKLPPGDDLDDIFIKAPAAGIVMRKNITVGSVVERAFETFTIADLSSVWMMASVHESEIFQVKVGSTAQVEVQSYPGQTFSGRVTRINSELDPQTRAVQVRILLPNAKEMLRAEMYAKANIQGGGTKPVIVVPESAIQTVNGVTGVFVRVSEEEFDIRPVETGRIVTGGIEVVAGLASGDAVVTKGGFLLKSRVMKRELEQE